MKNAHIKSAYIVHTQVIGLADRPFPSMEKIRPVWNSLFDSEICFTKLRTLIWDSASRSFVMEELKEPPIFPRPFIRNFGLVCFNIQSVRLEDSWHKEIFEEHLCGEDEFWKNEGNPKIFGYDQELEDQRMNYLCFETCKSLFIMAKTEDKTRAEGKVFIHIYPTGYLVLHLVIAINWDNGYSLKDFNQIFQEIKPWRRDSRWIWSSKIGNGKLYEIIQLVRDSMQKSFCVDSSISLREGSWQSTLKLISNAKSKEIAKEFLFPEGKYEILDMKGDRTYLKYLLASRQGLICVFHPKYKRKAALHFFWKILFLSEFVAFKRRIYEDYAEFLYREVRQLKDFRLSPIRKARKEDLLKLSVYDHKIPLFVSALDNYIRLAAPFHRRIYSTISIGTDFNACREKLLGLVEKWEEEVALWEPTLFVLWKKIISPLRSLLSSGK